MEAVWDDKIFTVEDIEALPEGKRVELIDGIMYDMAAPSATHQRLVSFFTWSIQDYIRRNNGDCEVFPAPFAVYLNKDEYNYLEPDISVICDPSRVDEKGCHGAPDWIVEIVSPSNRTMDYLHKLLKYERGDVREYWVVDPEKLRVTVYRFGEKELVAEYGFDEEIPVGIYEDFSLKVQSDLILK